MRMIVTIAFEIEQGHTIDFYIMIDQDKLDKFEDTLRKRTKKVADDYEFYDMMIKTIKEFDGCLMHSDYDIKISYDEWGDKDV